MAAPALDVVTWNVLHRIHAVNWDEPVRAAWPDERARCAAIANALATMPADVICLQEVSGDQLAAIRGRLGDGAAVLATAYPRVPHYYRRFETTPLGDPTEYLVVIARGAAHEVRAEPFASDGGKGFLRVELARGVTVIDTHVSYGDRHAAQCARLAEEVAAARGPVVVCGDFNADRDTCARRLPDLIAAIVREPALPTRPRQEPSEKSQTIDHVFVRDARVLEAAVLDGQGLSDHNPVRARLTWD